MTLIEHPISTQGDRYENEDGYGRYQLGLSSIMIMLIEHPILTQGEGNAIEDGRYRPGALKRVPQSRLHQLRILY